MRAPTNYASTRMDNHRAAFNYLLLLRTCGRMFLVLSLLSAVVVIPQWGVDALTVVTLTWAIDMQGLVILYVLTWSYGLIALWFSLVFDHCAWRPGAKQREAMLMRTLWLSHLPVHDSQTGKIFEYFDYELRRVENSLEDVFNHKVTTMRLNQVCSTARTGRLEKLGEVNDLVERMKRCVLKHDDSALRELYTKLEGICNERSEASASTCVEKIQLAVVVDRWYALHAELQDIDARLQKNIDLVARYEKGHSSLGRACWLSYYRRKLRQGQARFKRLEKEFILLKMGSKRLSGSVFVTLTESRDCNAIMAENAPSLWGSRRHSYFTFGQKPFASVTLQVRRAPHPDDVIWENLHITELWQRIRFWIPTVVLVFAMVVLVRPLTRYQTFEALIRNYTPAVGTRGGHVAHQLPTLAVQVINTLLLPLIIAVIADNGGNYQRSEVELLQLKVNFFFMVFNTAVLPVMGLSSLPDLVDWTWTNLLSLDHLRRLPAMAAARLTQPWVGTFGVQYLINSTGMSGAWNELQPAQVFWRRCALRFAVTEKEKEDARTPWFFAWGYWYAYMLSCFVLGLSMSIAVPLSLPVSCACFYMRHCVDSRNLAGGEFRLGPEECGFVPRVLFYFRLSVVLFWFLMGLGFWVWSDTAESVIWEYRWLMAVPLCVAAIALLFYSVYSRNKMIVCNELALQREDDFIDAILARFGRLVAWADTWRRRMGRKLRRLRQSSRGSRRSAMTTVDQSSLLTASTSAVPGAAPHACSCMSWLLWANAARGDLRSHRTVSWLTPESRATSFPEMLSWSALPEEKLNIFRSEPKPLDRTETVPVVRILPTLDREEGEKKLLSLSRHSSEPVYSAPSPNNASRGNNEAACGQDLLISTASQRSSLGDPTRVVLPASRQSSSENGAPPPGPAVKEKPPVASWPGVAGHRTLMPVPPPCKSDGGRVPPAAKVTRW